MDPMTAIDNASWLQYGAMGLLAFLLVFGCWSALYGIRAVWAWFTNEEGPIERFIAANAEFVSKQAECNAQMTADHATTVVTMAQIRRAGKRAVVFAREIADKLELSDNAKQCLREAEAELDS